MKIYQKLSLLILMLGASFVTSAGWTPYISAGAGIQRIDSNPKLQGARTYNAFVQKQFNNDMTAPLASMALGISNQVNKAYYAVQAQANYNSGKNASDTWITMDETGTVPAYYNTLSSRMPWRLELDGIAGYYFKPTWMAYGKIGATTTKLKSSFEVGQYQQEPASTPAVNMNLYGVVFGLGIRHDLTSNWHVGLEGDYVHFFNKSKSVTTSFTGDANPVTYTFNYKPQSFLVEATLTYSF